MCPDNLDNMGVVVANEVVDTTFRPYDLARDCDDRSPDVAFLPNPHGINKLGQIDAYIPHAVLPYIPPRESISPARNCQQPGDNCGAQPYRY